MNFNYVPELLIVGAVVPIDNWVCWADAGTFNPARLVASWAIDLSVGNPSVSFWKKDYGFTRGNYKVINRLTDDEAAAKLLPMGAPGKCEGWEVGCLIDPGSEGDGEGMLLRSGVLDVWPLKKIWRIRIRITKASKTYYH